MGARRLLLLAALAAFVECSSTAHIGLRESQSREGAAGGGRGRGNVDGASTAKATQQQHNAATAPPSRPETAPSPAGERAVGSSTEAPGSAAAQNRLGDFSPAGENGNRIAEQQQRRRLLRYVYESTPNTDTGRIYAFGYVSLNPSRMVCTPPYNIF